MSKNGNRPANSTYHFRCATGFAQRTMSPNNGTSIGKKKSNTCNILWYNKSADDGIKRPNRAHLPLKIPVETYTVQHRYTNALSAAISMHRQG